MRWVLGGTLVLSLACGGLGGGGSARAVKLCDHLADERECPCDALGVGSTPTIDGLTIEILSVTRIQALDELPEIQNSDERSRIGKVKNNAIAVEVAFTNTKPVKSSVTTSVALKTPDGESWWNQPYNAKVQMKGKDAYMDLWDSPTIGPDRTKKTIMVFPAYPGEDTPLQLHLFHTEKKPDPKDPRGRRKTFTLEQVVLDLPDPTEAG